MGVYINMETPTSCGYCPLRHEARDGDECYLGASLTEYQERPDDCPLVPVPEPHGRLGDLDALDVIGYCGIPQGYEDTFDSGVIWLAEQIDELPTIIPASEEG